MSDAEAPKQTDYKSTLFLPQTEFPMRAGLPKKEPGILEFWNELDVYKQLRNRSKGNEKFILHDGPPYANGNIHIGHSLNKILKDVVVRSQQMMGKDAAYVPGWDCHGLPIEWKIEEKYRKKKKDKDDIPVAEFRKECRDFAEQWIDVQREEFKRLGVTGDWENPYKTMDFKAEAIIAKEFMRFVMNGGLYRGSKPVMWSVVEKTALAEAEVEYHDHTSPTIHIRFPIINAPSPELEGASVVIWTTTPWTMPANRAVAFGENIAYGVYQVKSVKEGSHARVGEKLVLADDLIEAIKSDCGIEELERLSAVTSMAGTICAHPLRDHGYDHDVPALPGDFVTTEQGTGFVHIAPSHGTDDFELGVKYELEVPFTVAEDGRYYDHVPLFAGKTILWPNGKNGNANDAVIEAMVANGGLLASGKLVHSYPHSWRSKAPLIFRNTPQWFISMKTNDLRAKALKAIDEVRWVPAAGRNRIYSMIEERPDWVVSRQRAWGVPLTIFVHKETGELLRDEDVNERIYQSFLEEGADAWFESDPSRFLGSNHAPEDYEMVHDILDVWFDSGASHAHVLEEREDLQSPADLYLEGSDQHRGWFHSSLLESCGTRGHAPYKAVLTHGFTMDQEGRKMSKSLGNVIAPQKIVEQYGADILRLWVVSCNFIEDQRIGDEIIKTAADSYRKLRNTLRFMLGNLDGFEESERLSVDEMPELERFILHRLASLDEQIRHGYENFEYSRLYQALFNFCTLDLSAFYFDIRKDALYCDAKDSIRRRAVRTVLDELFRRITVWAAPLLCFTMEEVWQARFENAQHSVHFETFPDTPSSWKDDELAKKWVKVRELRRVVTGALEIERREKRIGSSLAAKPTIFVSDTSYIAAVDGLDLGELCITSEAILTQDSLPDGAFALEDVSGIAVLPTLAEGEKCQRCWMVLPDVGSNATHTDVCGRCATAIDSHGVAAE